MIPAHIADWANRKRKDDDVAIRRSVLGGVAGQDQRSRDNSPDTSKNPIGNPNQTNPSEMGINAKGGGSTPPMPDPMAEAKATAWLEQQRADMKAKTDAANKVVETVKEDTTKQDAARAIEQGYTTGQKYGSTQLGAKGYDQGLLDKYNVLELFNSDLTNQKAGMDPLDTTPTYNTSSALLDAINTGQGAYRSDVTRGIKGQTGENFSTNLFPDTADDSILNAILGTQKTDATTAINAARDRGLLNATGYSKALTDLGTAETAGMGNLQSIGGGVLSGYRTGLDTLKNSALSTAGGLTLADVYDLGGYGKSISDLTTADKGKLSGDIYKAVGDQKFFDIDKLIASAGGTQGYYNPSVTAGADTTGSNPLMDQFAADEKKRLTQSSKVF